MSSDDERGHHDAFRSESGFGQGPLIISDLIMEELEVRVKEACDIADHVYSGLRL
jgi:hypothetical protein